LCYNVFMQFTVITLFPEIIESYLSISVLKRARKKQLIRFRVFNIRDFTRDRHKTVDDAPYGGGAGMVFKIDPIVRAVESALRKKKGKKSKVIILSAKGRQFDQKMAVRFVKQHDHLILISGRYEGIDERVKKILKADEVSIGPYVMTDGDVGVMAIISAVGRLIPGVIRLESLTEESHWEGLMKSQANTKKILEYPHYTRPEIYVYKGKTYRVPKILLSGDHARIAEWRKKHITSP